MISNETENEFSTKSSLEDFQIIKFIGEGAFSNVYMSIWMSNKCDDTPDFVAIKVIKNSKTYILDIKSKVENEIEILSSLSNKFIIKYFTSFYCKASLNIVLEYLPANVYHILKKKIYFGESTARYFSSQILLGLEFLHSKNIAYRDLKPENTMINSDWRLKLTDFSFSKKITGRSYTCQGTLEYMAPEIVLNQGHGLGVDWWAFGILLFELCAGHSPFKSKYQLNLMKKIIAAKFQFPIHFSDELRDLIKKLLVIDVTQRLGCIQGRSQMLKNHSWFSDEIDWDFNETVQIPKELCDINLYEITETENCEVELLI